MTTSKWKDDLIKDIRTGDSRFDNSDGSLDELRTYHGQIEVTKANRDALEEYFLRVKDTALAILEIGISRNGPDSFTQVFLKNKKDSTIYIGIDIDNKSYLDDKIKNIYTIQNSSSNIDENMSIARAYGVDKFDFIFIDGWHSINQVLTDWEYTRWLSDTGIVGFHDTASHPGPYYFINAVDKNKWNVVENCCPDDWGVGFVWKKCE
jgi:hypothetical protein